MEESVKEANDARRGSLRMLSMVRGSFDAVRAESARHKEMYEAAQQALKDSTAAQQQKAFNARAAERTACKE
eukprot:1980087-Pleurochrysis_carterae.AAC.1